MSFVEVSFQELVLMVWQFHLPEWHLVFVYLFKFWHFSHIHSCFIPSGFGCGGPSLTIHLGSPYRLPNFSGYPEALFRTEYNSSWACKCVKYLLLICPIIGPAYAILSQIRKCPHRVWDHDILEINVSCNWLHDVNGLPQLLQTRKRISSRGPWASNYWSSVHEVLFKNLSDFPYWGFWLKWSIINFKK